jgi:hypothetical protein
MRTISERNNVEPDFIVDTSGGSIWTFEPVTQIAKNFTGTDLDVQSWQWIGPKFGVDARIANDLVSALEDEKFTLELK